MKKHVIYAALLGLSIAVPASADNGVSGGRRLNSLHTDVAVRHRRLLVKHRFEVTPLFESTINADFQHTIGGGLKLEYHLSDMLSIGVIGVYGTSLHTSLVDKLTEGPAKLPTMPDMRQPSQEEFLDHLNAMPVHGAAYVSLTPWYGKLAAFSSAFVAFDFYFQGGISFASLTGTCPSSSRRRRSRGRCRSGRSTSGARTPRCRAARTCRRTTTRTTTRRSTPAAAWASTSRAASTCS